MCAKVHDTNAKRYIKLAMNCLIKLCLRLLKRLSRLTVCEFWWICLISFIFTLVWVLNIDDNVVKISAQNPVILWWSTSFPGTSETRYCPGDIKCDVYSNRSMDKLYNVEAYLFYGSDVNFDDLPLPRKPKEIIWGLYHEESPRNVVELMHENILSLFNFSSTISRYSNVPFPLQYLTTLHDVTSTEYFVNTSLRSLYLKEIAPIMYLQSDCETATERDAYVKELMKFIKVDSYGACLNNKEMSEKFKGDYLNNLNEDEFLRFIARYKFVIAIENGICDDYVTEKFWRAIKVGTVPIYFGSPSIKDWFPNEKSAILLEDYPTPEIMSKHIKSLLENDDLYEEYLEHKIKRILKNKRLIDEFAMRPYQNDPLTTAQNFECLICKKLHEKNISEVNVVNKSHYNCPKPVSALTLQVNPANDWVHSWEMAKKKSYEIYQKVISAK